MAGKTEKKYVLINRRSGKALAVCGTNAVQMTADGSEAQIWCAVPVTGTELKLVHKATGLTLNVSGEAENGAALTLAEESEQTWKLTTTTKGFRKLVHVASGKVVDIKDISDTDGAAAQLWDFVKGENQEWVANEVEKKAPAKRAAKTAKAKK